MKTRRKLAVIVIGMLALAPVAAIAQTPGHGQTPGATAPSAGAPSPMPMPMHGMMEQMQHMMRQMADGLKSGTMTPEQQKAMGQTLERMTAMMDQMHRMAAERQAMHERMSQMMQQMGGLDGHLGLATMDRAAQAVMSDPQSPPTTISLPQQKTGAPEEHCEKNQADSIHARLHGRSVRLAALGEAR